MFKVRGFLRRAVTAAAARDGRRLPWFAAGLSVPLLSLGLLAPGVSPLQQDKPPLDLGLGELTPAFALPLLFNSSDLIKAGEFGNPGITADGSRAIHVTVQRGDTLERIFRKEGLDISQLKALLNLESAQERLRLLRPGDELYMRHDGPRLLEISRRLDTFRKLEISRHGEDFRAAISELEFETRPMRAEGEIRSSLFGAASKAGIADATILKLANIFASQVDFVLDLRQGDSFAVVYEEKWHDGEKLDEGEILAAEFVNQGKIYRAVRYEGDDGRASYYTPEGLSLRKAFVRVPLTFSRISSDFSLNRKHPVLNRIRAHTGVDYAAPTGTPVHAPGDGRVAFSGRKGGYGNAIILEHGNGITTLYGHLSRFAKGIRVGQRVDQGDVIGYVGSTGLATGPHLHYEYRINGKHMNPRTVKLPEGSTPLKKAELEHFKKVTAPLLHQLENDENWLVNDGRTGVVASGKRG